MYCELRGTRTPDPSRLIFPSRNFDVWLVIHIVRDIDYALITLAYLATKLQFFEDAPQIEDIVRDRVKLRLGHNVGMSLTTNT